MDSPANPRLLPVRPGFAPPAVALPLTLLLAVATLVPFALAASALPTPFPPGPGALMALHLLTTGFLVPVALAAALQLTGALLGPAPHGNRAAWLLLPAWAGGVMIPLGLGRVAPLLPLGGAIVTIATAAVALAVFARLVRRDPRSAPLRLGMAVSLTGILLTELAGLRMALVGPGAETLSLHVALAATATFLPLLVAVSGQLFPMFAHAAPPRPPRWLLEVRLTSVGALGTVLAAATGLGPLMPASLGVLLLGLALWVLEQERAHARRRGRQRDPAVTGARPHALALVGAALVALVGSLLGDGSLTSAAVAFGIVGGIGGSVVSYLRRILPFVFWQALYRRHGTRLTLPRLDELRPPVPAGVLPGLWLAGSALLAALALIGPAVPIPLGHPLLLLGAAGILAAFELLAAPVRVLRFELAHRPR